ncbi:hypothetical protein MNBD_GAMMA09-2659 [hydrothermal vent metagenome]|uniref:MobA-like NTP transferase domain-containing protein n=1 Tax=hydrothermal vent metagenome TaxID=652676 RepID=A0A3B0Y226_9ZZZZ
MIYYIILAAGTSQRFGADKTQLCIDDTPMAISIALILKKITPNILIIINEDNEKLQQATNKYNIDYRLNPSATNSGIGSSISRAVKETRHADGWIFCLGDMPFIQPDTYIQVYNALNTEHERSIILPRYNKKPGHPVGFTRFYQTQLEDKTGDTGARTIINNNINNVHYIQTEDAGILIDIDTKADFDRML